MQRSLLSRHVAMATAGSMERRHLPCHRRDEGLNYGVAVCRRWSTRSPSAPGGPQVVFSQTKHPEEAMTFIKWYMKEENSWDSLIATGIWMPILRRVLHR